ncbi:uncharacterized protein LOC127240369 [Andrographis paniculata]|uniref:uncharacterized protein LOC127240369 n=1 Tax=Andrographis paniculata TaxID=175694 RepID=UPI0021E90456|nr:uncharacterized protein LOC127240369 [Andrographis paniculata]
MKLVWSPEIALKAYTDTVISCGDMEGSSVAEFISAMAAGWNARLVVETWTRGGAIASSIGLAIATRHSGGRHVCVVPDEDSRSAYIEAMRNSGQAADVVVGRPEEAVEGLEGIDFLLVDCSRNNFASILRVAKLGHRGAVLICKNASSGATVGFRWRNVLDQGLRIVRSEFLPVGKGLDMAYIGAKGGGSGKKGQSRWIKTVDSHTGEEFVIRK